MIDKINPPQLVSIKFVSGSLAVSNEYVRHNAETLGLHPIRSKGGHRRYLLTEVKAAVEQLRLKRFAEIAQMK